MPHALRHRAGGFSPATMHHAPVPAQLPLAAATIMPGLSSCAWLPQQAVKRLQEWLDLGPTHIAPSWRINPHNGDNYSAYNKPLAVIDFLSKNPPEEEWLIILDADIVMREPLVCKGASSDPTESRWPPALELNCERGRPFSSFFGYLKGVSNELAVKHLPDVAPRNDTAGGQPFGRRGDMVGGFLVVHRDDMLQYMNDWVTFTEAVRFDPDVRWPPSSACRGSR